MVLGLLFLPPIYECLDLGQTGLIVAALVTYDYLHQGRTQGLLTGVAVALKLLPIVFVLWWLFNREWRAARNGLLTFAGLSLLAFALWRKSFRYFVRVVIGHGAEFHQLLTGPKLRANSSVVAMLVVGPQRTFFMTHKWLLAVIVTVAIVFLFVAVRSLLARDMPVSALLTLVIGSNVASLVTWDHYLVIVGLIPLLWISEIPIHRGTGKLIAAALALYLVPWWRIRYGRLNHSWSHTLHVTASLGLLAATAIFLAGVLGEARRRHEAQASALMKRTLVA